MGVRFGTRATALVAVAGLALGVGLAAVPASAPPVSAAVGDCPEGTVPPPGNPGTPPNEIWTDQNIAVYAGGNFTAQPSAAEVEGLMVVAGDTTIDSPGRFNVGWVGVGSSVAPYPGTPMLATGGDLTVAAGTILDVGSGAVDPTGALLGGDVRVGGATHPDYATNGLSYDLNNGTLTQGMGADAIAPWATFGASITSESATYAALATTGTAVASFGTLTLTGNGTSNPQVFSVTGAQLAASPAVAFVGLAPDVPVIINVTGTAPVTWSPNFFSDNGVRADDLTSNLFGMVASRTLWNFTQTTSVTIGGSSQVLGSMLVPGVNPTGPTLSFSASTNGRLYTNGSILMTGSGTEHHNYPWLSAPFNCVPINAPAEGHISITKTLDPADAGFIPPGSLFHGTVTCPTSGGGELIVEWAVAAGGTTVVSGLPVGATCVVAESLGAGARLTLPRPGEPRVVTSLLTWNDPVWTVNGVVTPPPVSVVVPDPADTTQIAIGIANALAVGQFTIAKEVTGTGAPSVGFSGTWSCVLPGTTVVVASGTWTLTAADVAAGTPAGPFAAPVDAVCTTAENAPTNPPDGTWAPAVIAPNPVTITQESVATPIAITVTNAFTEIGAFTIAKSVTTNGTAPDVSFSGAWSCEQPAGTVVASGTWTAAAGQTAGPFEAPVGAVCTVTETQPADPPTGTWAPASISPNPITIPAGSLGAPVALTVTNTFTENGAFTIAKTVEGDGAPATSFTGTWSCEQPAGTVVASGTWTAAAGQTAGPFGAPVGAVCTVQEDAAPPPANGLWELPVIDPESVTIPTGSLAEPVGITVTNTFVASAQLGAFQVLKVVDDPDGVVYQGPFTGSYTCDTPDLTREVLSGTWTVVGSGLSDVIEAPVGSVCSITEVQPANPPGGTWGTPVITPGSLTVTAESAQTPVVFTVTNTLSATGGGGGATAGGGELSTTGGTPALWALPAGLAAIAGGILLTIGARRRGA